MLFKGEKKISGKVILYSCLFVVLIFSLFSLYQFSHHKEISKATQSDKQTTQKFAIYNPKASIKNYEFINNKNGIVVEWDYDRNELKESKKLESPEWIRANSDYLVRIRKRLRSDTAMKDMKKDEYYYLDVFDLTPKVSVKHELNLWKTLTDYLDKDDFKILSTLSIIQKKENEDYIIIKIEQSNRTKFLSINLRTLKVKGEETEESLSVQNNAVLALSQSNDYKAGVLLWDNQFVKNDDYSGDIQLKNTNFSAYQLFSKKDSVAYRLMSSENGQLTNGSELLEVSNEFLKPGESVFDDAYLPAKWSTKGVDTKIANYDELMRYYNNKMVYYLD